MRSGTPPAGRIPSGETHPPATPPADTPFNPALIVVDLQNDFCPPNGTLAVAGGRDLAQIINPLLSLPGFVIRIATQDFHPPNHISFASNHPPPNNVPFEGLVPLNNWESGRQEETVTQRLWPVHCVQKTNGADLIDELQRERIDVVVQKGMDSRSEMYSVFADSFGNFNCTGKGVTHDVAKLLKDNKVSHVFVVGLAGDFCVKHTAVDSAKSGFTTYVVQEGTQCVDSKNGWAGAMLEFQEAGVNVVAATGPEVRWVESIK